METEWERTGDLGKLRLEEAPRILADTFPDRRVVDIGWVSAGKVNTNGRVRFASGPDALLRFHEGDPESCVREQALRDLVRNRVAVQTTLASNSEQNYSILEWIEGITLDDLFVKKTGHEPAEQIGKVLAAIHSFPFPEPGFLGQKLEIVTPLGEFCSACSDHSLECLTQPIAVARLGSQLSTEAARCIDENRGLLDPYRGQSHLIHSDFKGANVLVREAADGWNLAAVIDWEFACAGAALIDFGNLLRHEGEMPVGFGEAVADSYCAAGGFLAPGWRQAAKLIDLTSLAQFLTTEGDRPRMISDVVRLVQKTVDSFR